MSAVEGSSKGLGRHKTLIFSDLVLNVDEKRCAGIKPDKGSRGEHRYNVSPHLNII